MQLVNCETREKIFFVTRELTREIRCKHFSNPTENFWSNEKFFGQKKGCNHFPPKKTHFFQKKSEKSQTYGAKNHD